MTHTIIHPSPSESSLQPPAMAYRINCQQGHTHLLWVTLRLTAPQTDVLDLHLPVWTPGSYLVREYARHLQDFTVTAADGTPLEWWKCAKNQWQVACTPGLELEVRYAIYAHELSVRTNHFDPSHAYFNPAAVCLYVPEYRDRPLTVTIVAPPHWRVTTPLEPFGEDGFTFWAANYDLLVDSPFEVGTHPVYAFEVDGKPHELAVWGKGNFEPQRAIADMQRIIETEASFFGGLPYDRYVFILHLTHKGYGGLEHLNSCSLIFHRFGFQQAEQYRRFLCLVAHEFFHLWNVKRIRPQAFEIFDYDSENYTTSLWFVEGITSYFDQLIPLWAGLFDAAAYLKLLSESLNRYLHTPGRFVQSLSAASFDAWIKLYRPDENSINSQMSYYLKGELVALLLDLRIRLNFNHQRSLLDVLRRLWQQYCETGQGYTPDELWETIETVADENLGTWREQFIEGTVELPLQEWLAKVGLELVPQDALPYTGLQFKQEHGALQIKAVLRDSPAEQAGLVAGDEIIALNGWRVKAEDWSERLREYPVGETIHLTWFHDQQLHSGTLMLGDPQPRYQVQCRADATPSQRAHLEAWLGATAAQL
ncbi:PDZ domain-containing protein [Thermosynechococcus sp. QKsg1]|uniref:M61 family metallopeptidase n=1 Tax=Thermosynechococcus sp. QKsg1 TaxID=3074130 RepID=UPI002877BDE2|nr:PDZ domain-containing protein [Thermosynechococcus sp. QKsg1]WNC85647.1 PDZ domain-containing protein [Thermosynechococcus sp. QKsg1]